MTMTWACARPVPALLTAVHSYVPSSALEARGISQLLFPDALQTHNKAGTHRHTAPSQGPPPSPTLGGPVPLNPARGRGGGQILLKA